MSDAPSRFLRNGAIEIVRSSLFSLAFFSISRPRLSRRFSRACEGQIPFSTMVLLLRRGQPVAARAAAALFLLLSLLSSSSPSLVLADEKTIKLSPFRGVSICAPISVRIVDAAASNSSNGGGGFSALLVGEKAAIDAVSLTTTGTSLSVQLSRDLDLDTGPGTLELEIALPAGTLQYVERVHAPGDTVILSEFDREKAEVASSGAGGIWMPFLNGREGKGSRRKEGTKETKSKRLSMAKISLSAPGKVVAAGDAGFWEVFTADERADVRIDGVAAAESENEESPYSTVSVRLDAGRAFINPATSSKENHVSISGFALAPLKAKPAVLEYSSGQCSARKEVFGERYKEGDTETLPVLGSACDKVSALPAPSAPPRGLSWSCGLRAAGSWNCGGPGLKGKPGTVVVAGSCAATKEQLEAIARV